MFEEMMRVQCVKETRESAVLNRIDSVRDPIFGHS